MDLSAEKSALARKTGRPMTGVPSFSLTMYPQTVLPEDLTSDKHEGRATAVAMAGDLEWGTPGTEAPCPLFQTSTARAAKLSSPMQTTNASPMILPLLFNSSPLYKLFAA